MTVHTDLEAVVKDNNSDVYMVSADMIRLEVVQGAVASLMERIDEITHKGWHKEPAMARASIDEIRDTVRLIDMAFYPMFCEIKERVKIIEIHSNELFDMVVKGESEQLPTK